MKKTIMAVCLAVCGLAYADRTMEQLRSDLRAATTAGAKKALFGGMTANEWRTAVDAAVATTNKADASWAFTRAALYGRLPAAEQALTEKDQALADAGCKVSFWSAKRLPKCYAGWKAEYASKFPKTVAYVDANGSIMPLYRADADPAALFNIAAEFAANNSATNSYCVNNPSNFLARALQSCAKDIKKALRRQGKSIITRDGVNPIQVEVDKLAAAINAPKMAGLGALVSGIWPGFAWEEPAWPLDSHVGEIKAKVLDGDLELDANVKMFLLYNLGVEEYNKFVNQYNN